MIVSEKPSERGGKSPIGPGNSYEMIDGRKRTNGISRWFCSPIRESQLLPAGGESIWDVPDVASEIVRASAIITVVTQSARRPEGAVL